MSAVEIYFHNIYKATLKWRESTLKRYEITLTGSAQHEGRSLICLELAPNKPDKDHAFTLYIDEASYAVARMVEYWTPDRKNYQESVFRELNGKWYISHVLRRYAGSTFFQRYQPGSVSDGEVIYIYNLLPGAKKTEAFKGILSFAATPKEEFISNWEEPFWDKYRNIPLPAWIQEIVEAEKQ